MRENDKVDLYRVFKEEYAKPKRPTLVTIKKARYLSVVGQGEPGGELFHTKIGALYAVAYTLKFASKLAGRDYKVCGLEGLWWGDDPTTTEGLNDLPKEEWNWNLMIRVPDFITQKELKSSVKQLLEKGKGDAVNEVKLQSLTEGRCVQMLHIGPYDQEQNDIAAMRAYAESQGLNFHGLHHELYLSDPRRVPPERLKTILRQPVHKSK